MNSSSAALTLLTKWSHEEADLEALSSFVIARLGAPKLLACSLVFSVSGKSPVISHIDGQSSTGVNRL